MSCARAGHRGRPRHRCDGPRRRPRDRRCQRRCQHRGHPGADAELLPQPNIALELFCCFAKHEIEGKGTIANLDEIADTWIFPPALTAQYHFTGLGRFEPYVGVGLQYINFFDTGAGDNLLGAQKVSIDAAVGFTLQAGLDISLGDGWYLNADVKKTLIDTVDLLEWGRNRRRRRYRPWIFSAGLGYRFNLFGPIRTSLPDKVKDRISGRTAGALRCAHRALFCRAALADNACAARR